MEREFCSPIRPAPRFSAPRTSAAIAGRPCRGRCRRGAQIERLVRQASRRRQRPCSNGCAVSAHLGRALDCACSRIAVGKRDRHPDRLRPSRRSESVARRARAPPVCRQSSEAIAVFTPDGRACSRDAARQWTQLAGSAPRLADLGYGIATDKLGEGASTMLVVRLSEFPQTIGRCGTPIRRRSRSDNDLGCDRTAIEAASATLGQTPASPIATQTLPCPPQATQTNPTLPRADRERRPMPRLRRAARRNAERRHPLRFVWEMDADGRFTIASDEFIDADRSEHRRLARPAVERDRRRAGARSAGFGRTRDRVARHLERDHIGWPVETAMNGSMVELAGLPAYDRDRKFRGYRGFGVCRDVARINAIMSRRAPLRPTATRRSALESADRQAETRPTLSVVPARKMSCHSARPAPTANGDPESGRTHRFPRTRDHTDRAPEGRRRAGARPNHERRRRRAREPGCRSRQRHAGNSRALAEERAPLHEPR